MQQEKHSSVSLNGQAILQLIHLSLRAANPSKLQEMLDCFEHRVGSKKPDSTWRLKTFPTRTYNKRSHPISKASQPGFSGINFHWKPLRETSKTWQPTASYGSLLGMWIIPGGEASIDESYLSIKWWCLWCSWRSQTWYSNPWKKNGNFIHCSCLANLHVHCLRSTKLMHLNAKTFIWAMTCGIKTTGTCIKRCPNQPSTRTNEIQ